MGNMLNDHRLKQQVIEHAKNLAAKTKEAKPFTRYDPTNDTPQPASLEDFIKCVQYADYRPSLRDTHNQLDIWNSWSTGVYCHRYGVSYELEYPRLKPKKT